MTSEHAGEFAAARESDVMRELRAVTAEMPDARMQISAEVGQLLALLVRASGANKALEVGTFTGYSALCVAEALPPGGKLIACDVSEEWTAVGRRFWERAGVAGRIDLRLAPAAETLASLLAAGEAGTFDFAFLDADKEGYPEYYELTLQLLRPGGLVVVDNMFLGGRVPDPTNRDTSVLAVRGLTETAKGDDRVDPVILTVRDGLLLATKRGAER